MDKSEEEMMTVHNPALVAALMRAEELAERLLNEEEVSRIRENLPTVEVPKSVAEAMFKNRGYRDLSLTNTWSEWCRYRSGELDLAAD